MSLIERSDKRKMFPLIDRKTPVLDRIRRKEGEDKHQTLIEKVQGRLGKIKEKVSSK